MPPRRQLARFGETLPCLASIHWWAKPLGAVQLSKEETPVKHSIATALEQRGYTTLTPVQEAVTQPEVQGRDMLVSAQTGSGKTVGFGIALAPTLLGEADEFEQAAAPLALVIAPTRELAMQVRRELTWLYAEAGAIMASCVGGMDSRDERRALARGAHIVVATPGRLRDHIMRGNIDLTAIRAVVLDEADEMLDLGFREDLEFILGETPETRQTLLFSATVPRAIETLARTYQQDALRIVTQTGASQHADIDYRAMTVNARDVENAMINVLRFYEAPSAIVFCNTRAMVARMATRLTNRGFSVVSLSGELSQSERSHALQAMRDGRARVCVATDVAARGIDLPNLELVIHAELPSNHETLLHRSGRTGRAGRKGVSALIVPPVARKKAERILKFAKLTAEWGDAPSAEEVNARDEERLLADPTWDTPALDNEVSGAKLLEERFSHAQLALAYLRLNRERRTAPEELLPSNQKGAPEKRPPFGPSIWFSVSQPIEARRLMPMICKAGGISRDEIGAIRTQDGMSYVEIKQASVEGFLTALDGRMEVDTGATLEQLAEPPVIQPRERKPRPDRKFDDRKPEGRKPRRDKPEFDRPRDDKRPAPKGGKPKGERPKSKREQLAEGKHEGAVTGFKKREKPASKPRKPKNAADPGASLRKPSKSKALAPKVGKPNSKKNKARRAAAEAGKRAGGTAPPTRKP